MPVGTVERTAAEGESQEQSVVISIQEGIVLQFSTRTEGKINWGSRLVQLTVRPQPWWRPLRLSGFKSKAGLTFGSYPQ